jgi:hypothetical protein
MLTVTQKRIKRDSQLRLLAKIVGRRVRRGMKQVKPIFLFLFFFFLVAILVFEIRVSHLVGRCTIA